MKALLALLLSLLVIAQPITANADLFAIVPGSGSGGGSVSVTSASNDIIVTPSPGTATFTIGSGVVYDNQGNATTYTINATDMEKVVTHNTASAVAVSLPAPSTTGFGTVNSFTDWNLGAGTVTITCSSCTINGNSTLLLSQYQAAYFTNDGSTKYYAFISNIASGGAVSSFTGDGTIISNSASTGAVTATLANAAAGAILNNATGSAAAPTYTITPVIGSSSTSGYLTVQGGTAASTMLTLQSTDVAGTGFYVNNTSTNGHGYLLDSNGTTPSGQAGEFSIYDSATSSAPFAFFGGTSATAGATFQLYAAGVMGFTADASFITKTLDTGISRDSAGIIDVGKGTAGKKTGAIKAAGVVLTGTLTTGGYTVSALPAGTIGMRAYVTDQVTTCAVAGAALTGGGSVKCPVFYNGSAWVGD